MLRKIKALFDRGTVYWPVYNRNDLTADEKINAIIDYLGIEITKTRESMRVEARKCGK